MAAANRRDFLKTSAAAAAAATGLSSRGWAAGYGAASERPVLGYIGLGIRFGSLLNDSAPHGPCAAVCDVDAGHLARAKQWGEDGNKAKNRSNSTPDAYDDYRRILDRSDIDAVVIASPDHWHAKMVIEAVRAGKDVYAEKPLTLTIAEGRAIADALAQSDRVVQVGTQQRSGNQFQTAAALCRIQRVGAPKRLTAAIGYAPGSEALPTATPPKALNWDRWLGPAPYVDYCAAPQLPGEGGYGSEYPHSRAHGHFRWWYEYAGGKLTDWGAHHVDIAMWSLGKSDGSIGPYTVEPLRAEHPVEMVDGYPTAADRFNTATSFHVRVTFADGVELDILDEAKDLGFSNGVMYECEGGRYFVNRGKLTGKPAEDLADNPLPDSAFAALYSSAAQASAGQEDEGAAHNRRSSSHMKDFMDCLKSRETPISDVESHHRHLTVCHCANIAMRLGRKLTFDPATERFVGDEQASGFVAREYRKGYEIEG